MQAADSDDKVPPHVKARTIENSASPKQSLQTRGEDGSVSLASYNPFPIVADETPTVPTWVSPAMGSCTEVFPHCNRGPVSVRVRIGQDLMLVAVRWKDAAALNAPEFRDAARTIYEVARGLIDTPRSDAKEGGPTADNATAQHLVRVWNFIPSIHEAMGDGMDRYRVFNLGRFEAYESWLGADRFPATLPTATGVGHDGPDLVVYFLCAKQAGIPLENPRQRPAFEYSRRMGPRPPCFARATIIHNRGRPLMLIGGTASVYGEDSMHPGSLTRQLDETFENLAVLLAAADRVVGVEADGRPLRITHARVYHVHRGDEATALSAARSRLGEACVLEAVCAAICRPELLIEIEAVATVDGSRVEDARTRDIQKGAE